LVEEDVRRPAAAAAAERGVAAAGAVAPEVRRARRRARAEVHGQLGRVHDYVAQRSLADVAAGVGRRRERRAALDLAIGLDPQHAQAGLAARPERPLAPVAAEEALVRAVVADVVARAHVDAIEFRFFR